MSKAWVFVAVASLFVIGASATSAQTIPASTSTAKASAAPAASGKAGASAAPAAPSAAASAGDADALPPGHPSVDGDLPPGHPSLDDEDSEEAPANPHGGADPHGGPAGDDPHAGKPNVYTPPPDTSEDDSALPIGTLVVTVKDAQDQVIPHAPIAIGILHSTVAKGESRERLAKETDERGEARFDGLAFGSSTTYRVTTTRGPATYGVAPFALGDQRGKRAVVHSFEVSTDLDNLLVGSQAMVYLSLHEDSIQVEELVSIYNLGPVAWEADATVALPAGFKAFNKQEAMDDARVDEVKGTGFAIRGTFGPGRHDLDFRYQIPFDDKERQTLRIDLPPRVAQSRVIAEASKTMTLDVAGFPPAQRTQSREGKRLIVTERAVSREEGGVRSLEITLGGLPTPGPGRWIAIALAAVALALGISSLRRTPGDTGDEDKKKDLADAREALLREIVTLERMHKAGEMGPKTYARVRASLLDALARVVEQIERADEAARKGRREARAARRAT